MAHGHKTQATSRTPASLERVRARSRLLACGVTLRQVAAVAATNESMVSHVLAGRRSAASEAGRRIQAAACALSGLTWDAIMAPADVRPLAA
jgi:hypothetical protein